MYQSSLVSIVPVAAGMVPHARRSAVCLLAAVWTLAAAPVITGVGATASSGAGALHQLEVSGRGTQVVVALVADSPLESTVEVVKGSPGRVFVDLPNVSPLVARVTEVGRGVVSRVRVGLHHSEPPTTRVVVDLAGPAIAHLERGVNDRELRLVLDHAGPGDDDTYQHWFTRGVAALSQLFTLSASGTADAALASQWAGMAAEIRRTSPPPSMQAVHALLVTASDLGKAGMTQLHDGVEATETWSAVSAGARLLVSEACRAATRADHTRYKDVEQQPTVSITDGRLSVDVADVKLGIVLDAIARQGELSVEGHPSSDENVSAHFSDVPLERGLRTLLEGHRYGLVSDRRGVHLLLDAPIDDGDEDVSVASAPPLRARLAPATDTLRDPTIDALATVLAHHDTEVRLRAIETLALVSGYRATQLLEYAWAGDLSLEVRAAAWAALEHVKTRTSN